MGHGACGMEHRALGIGHWALGMEHGAFGMGHGAWDMGDRAWGIGHGAWDGEGDMGRGMGWGRRHVNGACEWGLIWVLHTIFYPEQRFKPLLVFDEFFFIIRTVL